MKGAIVFYSFSGNTKRACSFLQKQWAQRNVLVELIELKPNREVTAFLKQCVHAFLKKKPALRKTLYDLSQYHFVIFASPVWAFAIAPALRSYLERVEGLEQKLAACFLTFGSGTGSNRALKELESILRGKKAQIAFSKNISGYRTNNPAYLETNFKLLFEMLNP
ncbi:MAG: NAD(P)H-dependent oxidoreductase [Candidatus Omnitrophota bacterium]|nr:MAG: NAD(P)H-dependent oxidoreductase [Candidatus Omnitrophota bacterium]